MASNVRMKIAAGATVLGLGGLAGYALGSNDGPPPSASGQTTADKPKPKVHTQVVHRTIHVRPKGSSEDVAAGSGSAAGPGSAGSTAPAAGSAPTYTPAPAATPISDSSYSAPSTGTSGGSASSGGGGSTPPTTGSSGGGSGSGSSYESDDGGSEHENESGDD